MIFLGIFGSAVLSFLEKSHHLGFPRVFDDSKSLGMLVADDQGFFVGLSIPAAPYDRNGDVERPSKVPFWRVKF